MAGAPFLVQKCNYKMKPNSFFARTHDWTKDITVTLNHGKGGGSLPGLATGMTFWGLNEQLHNSYLAKPQ